jgi:hypothetical protein
MMPVVRVAHPGYGRVLVGGRTRKRNIPEERACYGQGKRSARATHRVNGCCVAETSATRHLATRIPRRRARPFSQGYDVDIVLIIVGLSRPISFAAHAINAQSSMWACESVEVQK